MVSVMCGSREFLRCAGCSKRGAVRELGIILSMERVLLDNEEMYAHGGRPSRDEH